MHRRTALSEICMQLSISRYSSSLQPFESSLRFKERIRVDGEVKKNGVVWGGKKGVLKTSISDFVTERQKDCVKQREFMAEILYQSDEILEAEEEQKKWKSGLPARSGR